MGFSTVQEVLCMCRLHVLKTENSVPCDMSRWSNGGNTGVNHPTISPEYHFWKLVLKTPQASETSWMLQYNN
jgi:hypothetical protein